MGIDGGGIMENSAINGFVFFILSGAFKFDLRCYLIAFSRHIFNWVGNPSYR
jgi:hypothetical protein